MRAASALSVCCPLSASPFFFQSLLSTVDGTDNRSLPGDLALKHYPSCWQQYSSRVWKWRKYHVLHTDQLLLQAPLRCVFPSCCTASVSLLLTEQVLKKQVIFFRCTFNITETKITVFMIKQHLKSIFIWQVVEHYHFGQQQQNTVIQVNRQLPAVCHPGCICPCKNKSVHIQAWTRGTGWDIRWRKDGKRTLGGREWEGKWPRWKYCSYNLSLVVLRQGTSCVPPYLPNLTPKSSNNGAWAVTSGVRHRWKKLSHQPDTQLVVSIV